MMRFTPRVSGVRHPGFTLIELLVVMTIIVFLAAIGMLIVPQALEHDRTVDAFNKLNGGLQMSRSYAQRDGLPRGLRLIVDPNKPDPLLVTEFQYIEAPGVMLPNPDGSPTGPFIQFVYTLSPGGAQPVGTITNRTCTANGFTASQLNEVVPGSTIVFPTLGTAHRITNINGNTLTLDWYPDAQFGAQSNWRTYQFGIYGPARPMLGKPTEQLPVDSCVDLNPGVSFPAGNVLSDYDILFDPSGRMLHTSSTQGAGQLFLWIRDPEKVTTMNPAALGGYTSAGYQNALRLGGEQLILGIKPSTGAIASAPVNWPDASSSDVYLNARRAVGQK